MGLGMKTSVSLTLRLTICQEAEGSVHHALLSQYQEELQAREGHEIESHEPIVKHEVTPRVSLKLERKVTETLSSVCCGVRKSPSAALSPRARHTREICLSSSCVSEERAGE